MMAEMQPDGDAELMRRICHGDREAFRRLVERYQQPVLQLIYRILPDANEAEDLAQAVFLQVFKHARRYDSRARFQAWLFTIARNLTLNEIRRRSRHPAASLDQLGESGPDEPSLQFEDTSATSPPEAALRSELVELVREAMMELPESQRTAITLFQEQHLSYEEISAILGVSLAATKSLIFRARESLKQRLKPYLQTGTWKSPSVSTATFLPPRFKK